jgi:hypothetical protein
MEFGDSRRAIGEYGSSGFDGRCGDGGEVNSACKKICWMLAALSTDGLTSERIIPTYSIAIDHLIEVDRSSLLYTYSRMSICTQYILILLD